MIQFEMASAAVQEFRKELTLSSDTLRFAISRIEGAFKVFVPSAPKPTKGRTSSAPAGARPMRPTMSGGPVAGSPVAGVQSVASVAHVQEAIKPTDAPKVTIEELDRRLEEILGEK